MTDTQQPYWTSDLPGDLTLECGADIPAQAELTAADACQAVVTVAEAQSQQHGRLWQHHGDLCTCGRPTDGCTDPISHTQTITIVDTTPPVITCADDALHLECGDSTHPDATGHSTATDICSTPVVTYHDGEDTDHSDCVETFIPDVDGDRRLRQHLDLRADDHVDRHPAALLDK